MTDENFVRYYEDKSVSPALVAHFRRLRQLMLAILGDRHTSEKLAVLDIGCNAGSFSLVWAEAGCQVSGIDINDDLVRIARERATEAQVAVDYRVGSAVALPWTDATFDVIVMPELLEHVADWRSCLAEATRVLRRGGLLMVSTTNRLCPLQEEFTLPAYSWYPGWLKKICLEKALTSHRQWVNFAAYPAVTWFDPYWLGRELRALGLDPMDRFDIFARYEPSLAKNWVGRLARLRPLRFLGHVMTPGTRIIARKQ